MIPHTFEVSIAGDVEEMVQGCQLLLFFFFFLNHIYLLRYKDNMQHIAIANKNLFLLSSGNIQTLKSFRYESNRTSHLSPIKILQTYMYIRRKETGKKQAGSRGEP